MNQRRERFLVACRDLENYQRCGHAIPPGHEIRGCEICHRKIVISPRAIEQASQGGFVVCNPCAMDMARRLQEVGTEAVFIANPAAVEQLQRMLARGAKRKGTDGYGKTSGV